MKIKSLKLINFRLFEEELFKFTPLTILTGPNSSGKSTLVKALTLLQENLKSPNYLGRLTFKEGNHRLGSFESVLKTGAEQKTIGFDLKIENTSIKRLGQDDRHIFDDVKYFNISLRYSQDSTQKENGLISEYRVDLEYEEGSLFKIIHLVRDGGSADIFINTSWLVQSLLDKQLFKINPKLHKIWSLLNPEDIQIAINEIISGLEEEKNQKLKEIDKKSFNSVDYEKVSNNVTSDSITQAKLNQLNKDISSYEREYEEKTKKLRLTIERLEQEELEKIKTNENDNEALSSIREQIEDIEIKLSQIEESYLNKQKEFEQQKNNVISEREYEVKKQIDEIKEKVEDLGEEEEEEVKQLFDKEIENINGDYIRTQLYNQIRSAARGFFQEEIGDSQINYNISSLNDNTLPDYLVDVEWRGAIESLVNQYASLQAIDIIPWNKETSFIKEKLLSHDPVFFMDLFSAGDEEGDYNQLTNNLITQLRIVIKELFQPLPFYALSAVRGLQQRFYQSSSSSSFDLEVSLSKLLSMQYQKEKEKLDFINHWVREFEIGQQVFAKVIEGDFIKGCIQDFEENGGQLVNLADKGLGISQLLPIIIAAADALESGMLICVEEPGTHLHPKLQSRLVDFVADGNSKNISFLFETHSEYFIRKLQWELANTRGTIVSGDINIKYLNRDDKDYPNVILIDSEGELVRQDGTSIKKFGEGFLDEATKWVNERAFLKSKKQEINDKRVKELMDGGHKVVFCENKNAEHLNALKLPGLKFIGVHDKRDVYFKHLTFQDATLGLVDRDYLADFEISKLTNKLPNFFMLNYYCFENYLYHPENISEITGSPAVEYINVILKDKKERRYTITEKAVKSRASYDFLKPSQKIFKDADMSKGNKEVMKLIESNDFEDFYKVFDMKRFCKPLRESLNISKSQLSQTSWFKQQIAALLRVPEINTSNG